MREKENRKKNWRIGKGGNGEQKDILFLLRFSVSDLFYFP